MEPQTNHKRRWIWPPSCSPATTSIYRKIYVISRIQPWSGQKAVYLGHRRWGLPAINTTRLTFACPKAAAEPKSVDCHIFLPFSPSTLRRCRQPRARRRFLDSEQTQVVLCNRGSSSISTHQTRVLDCRNSRLVLWCCQSVDPLP